MATTIGPCARAVWLGAAGAPLGERPCAWSFGGAAVGMEITLSGMLQSDAMEKNRPAAGMVTYSRRPSRQFAPLELRFDQF
ncbi:hypothetical protein [Bosea sp. R86505]|uniref:hypothetical protein n=1 Tax=Bosea sp. R86505 TaxID=3101710 RepID=UPI00366EADB8